jgi:prepilin-type processing-associated H-X9-DG protein
MVRFRGSPAPRCAGRWKIRALKPIASRCHNSRTVKPPRHQAAFSKLDLLVMVLAVVGIGLVVLPQIIRTSPRGSQSNCANHLRQIGLAFRLWAGDNNDQFPFQISVTNGGAMELAAQGSAYAVFLVMSNELNTPKLVLCPRDPNPDRNLATTFNAPAGPGATLLTPSNNISYFVGLDAVDSAPKTILAGDDHFNIGKLKPHPGLLLPTNSAVAWRNERHPNRGIVAFADGSVHDLDTPSFRAALIQTGIATNRLAMP